MANGMQNTIWASIRLSSPRSMPSRVRPMAKKESVATAVTISGTIRGRLMIT
jgi:hypothetical protein